jgi:hypothetical protein
MSRHASPHGGFLFCPASPLFEIARVLMRFNHVAAHIVNTDHCAM